MAADPTTIPGKRIPTDDDRRELRRAFTAWTRDPIVADDLVQETLFTAWNSDRQPDNPDEWRPWLFGVARNILLRWRRDVAKHGQRTAPAPESERHLLAASAPDDLDDLMTRGDIVDLLDAALGRLPAETRQALLLKYIDDLPQTDIADRLGVHEKALEGRLHRGKRAMHRFLITEKPDSAISLGLVSEPETWQDTGVWCPTCGHRTLIGKQYERGAVRFDCPACDNGWMLSGERAHIFSCSLATGSRPGSWRQNLTSLLGRARHHHDQGRDAAWPCFHCAGMIRPREFVDPLVADLFDSPIRDNILYTCDRCNRVESCTWLPGSGIVEPEGHAFWQDHKRIRLLPPQRTSWQGRPAVRTTWETIHGAHEFVTFYDSETWRLLHSETDGIAHRGDPRRI